MADYSMKQFLSNNGQFSHDSRPRSNSSTVSRNLMKKQSSDTHLTVPGHGRRMSCGSLNASRLSIASSVGSYNDSTIRQMETSGDLVHHGDDVGRGKVLLSFHYDRESQTLTVKVIQARDLRSTHGSDICAYATISFLPTSSTSRLETGIRMLTNHPVWKEVFRIRNFHEDNFREHKAFVIEVWDKTTSGSSQMIGEAVILLRSLTLDELAKGIVLWKYLSLDRKESELSLGELTFCVRQSHRKRCLTVKIDQVKNAAIPAAATTPCLYMKLMLLRGESVVLSDRTKAVSSSFSPIFNHKTHICLQNTDLRGASLKLLLKQEPTSRMNNLRRGSVSSAQHYFQKTSGVIHLGENVEREDCRDAWRRILTCKEKKVHFTMKFSAPRNHSIDN